MDVMHKYTLIVAIVMSICIPVAFGQTLDSTGDVVDANFTRSSYIEWTVLTDHDTPFEPVDPGLPEPFHFEDLQIGYGVLVEGHFIPGENAIHADIIFVFTDIPQFPHGVGGHPPHGGDRIFGLVDSISPSGGTFNIWVNQYQGEMMDVHVLPDAQFWDAPIGQPLTPINLWDFHPGDPVMVHGTMSYDHLFGIAFIRSMDWCPERSLEEGDTELEIYGWVDGVFIHPDGGPTMRVHVDSMTGDPNHQSFSKIIGPAGGTINFPWGYLFFPPNALNDLVNVQVTGDFMFWWTLENMYQFYPSMEFNLPVDIEIRYFSLDGIDPDQVRLRWFDEITGKWRIATHMTHVWEEHCFRGQIEHFSRYSLSTNNRPLQGIPLQPEFDE